MFSQKQSNFVSANCRSNDQASGQVSTKSARAEEANFASQAKSFLTFPAILAAITVAMMMLQSI